MKKRAEPKETGNSSKDDPHMQALSTLLNYVVEEKASHTARRKLLADWKLALKQIPRDRLDAAGRKALDAVMKGIEKALNDDPGQPGIKNLEEPSP
jgi:hypothetical protein